MTSATDATSAATTESSMETWKPSDVHRLVPTLVLLCGSITTDDAKSIEVNVQERLGANVPPNAVRWWRIEPPQSHMDVPVEIQLAHVLKPFLDLEYVEDLSAGGFLDVPSQEEPLDLQIVVVYDLTGEDESVASEWLQRLETALMEPISEGAKVSLTLLLIGEGSPDLGQGTTYWPRFRLQSRTHSGLKAERQRILEVCQNVLVALITSELARAIDHKVGPAKQSVGWIWIGASAVVVDLAGMREFVRQTILQALVHPLLREELTAHASRRIEQTMQDRVQVLQAANLASAMSTISNYGWDAESEEGTRRIAQMDLRSQDGHSKRGEMEWRLSDGSTAKVFPPEGDLSENLSAGYGIVRRSLIEHLGESASQQFDELCANFAFRMRPSWVPEEPEGQDHDILASTPRVDARPASLSLEEPLIRGLAGAAFAVERATEYLTVSPDVDYPGLSPHPVGSDYYLSATAGSDANIIHREHRRHLRYEKTKLSPQGFFLKLFPAWPLLTAIILILKSWDRTVAALLAALLLSALGLVQAIRLRRSLANLRKRVRSEIHRIVKLSVLRMTAGVLRGYRLLAAGQLREMAFNLRNLLSLLAREDARSLRRIAESQVRSDVRFSSQSTVYWVADWGTSRNYVRRAIRVATAPPGDFYNNITHMIAEMASRQARVKSRQLKPSCRSVFTEIERWAERLTLNVFHPPELKAHALAGNERPLENGRIWKWLYEKAEPLGGGAFTGSFTIFAGENPAAYEATTAALVEGSPYWVPGCQIAMSRQMHEINCIRGVIEDIGERHGLD